LADTILADRVGVALRTRTIAGAFLFAALAGVVFSQSTPSTTAPAAAAPESSAPAATTTPVKFEFADIHASPPRRFPFFDGAYLQNGRYMVRQATLADLITTAYGLKDSSYVYGGPSWLEWDRWDVIAKVPPGTTEATAKEMLKSLLEERFKLEAHNGEAQMPAYWLTVAPGGLKLKQTPGGTGNGECHGKPSTTGPEPDAVPLTTLSCTNKSLAALAQTLTNNRGGEYLQYPVVDKTETTGAFDFDLKFTPMYLLSRAGGGGITIFDALEKDLGLKLELKTAPQPGLLVDSANETPTPNAPDLAKIMPPLPPAQFEVAAIKPSAPDEKPGGRIAGDEINVRAWPLKYAIDFAWDLNANEELEGAPNWLGSDLFDVEAKVSTDVVAEGSTGQGRPAIAIEDLREMLKTLLIDRFEIKAHMEDRPKDAYTLVTVNSKMTRADPTERTGCKEGPGSDGKDPRLTRPILNMLITCRNVTMAQAVELFPTFAAWYIRYPVLDKTGLTGGWDFTLSWSSGNFMPSFQGQSPPASQTEGASDPNGALSFYDAVSKELGLKLVKEKRPEPVVVFDHIDQQPTPN